MKNQATHRARKKMTKAERIALVRSLNERLLTSKRHSGVFLASEWGKHEEEQLIQMELFENDDHEDHQ